MNTRTITGYLVTLLEYPRWLIDRDVDFTNCHLLGAYAKDDDRCTSCDFGAACVWLNQHRSEPTPETPLQDLTQALQTAIEYLRREHQAPENHDQHCDCATCEWLREANGFLRTHRNRT